MRSVQGLSGFLSLSYAPPERNKIDRTAVAGLSYRGLLPGQESDVAAFNVAYGHFSREMAKRDRALGNPTKDLELVLELNYRIAIAPWLFVQPDIQGIIHPGGSSDIDDAVVIGFAVGTVF